MPIYDYRCDHCGHAFSAVQAYKDEPLEVCPSCGKRPRRLMTTPSIVFKGSGWYKTDSRGAAPKETAPSDGSKPDAGGKAGAAETKAPAASTDKTTSSTG